MTTLFFYDAGTVFWRDFLVLRRRLVKFILSRMVAPILYLVAFGWGLGRSIDASGAYIDFLVPGIIALNSMNISFNSVTPVHAERVYHKSLEEYIIAPVYPTAFIVGKVLSALLRALISSAIIVALAFLFGAHFAVTPVFLLTLVLNCVIFAEIGLFATMRIDTYEEMSQVNTYVLLPMSFLCGTFFSADTLPQAVRFFIELLPLTHTSFLLRATAGGEAASLGSLAVLFVYAAVCFCFCRRAFLSIRE